jgi:TonB family protein
MKCFPVQSFARPSTALSARTAGVVGCLVLLCALGRAPAQAPATPLPDPSQQPAATTPAQQDTPQQPTTTLPLQPAASPQAGATATPPDTSQRPAAATAPQASSATSQETQAGAITEDEVRQLLVGKTLYLRDGYLDSSLSFDEHGKLIGHSPQGSYTLSLVEIDKVHLSKHKVELTGVRYGLHFLGARADEDPTKAVDKVRITPKKKVLKITIDRELVITPKKKKEKKGQEAAAAKAGPEAPAAGAPPTPASEPSDADQAKAEMNAAPEAERPADAASVTTTTSPAHAAHMLRDAIDHMFAQGLDERMIAAMPSFWKLYYQAVANQADYKPTDPAIYRQSGVDQKAKLLSTIEPPSNEYAQSNGVAGMALYHAVIGADGKPEEIVVSRPIGFGLDESAADTIRKASFQPATKDGKAVPVVLDLVVQFRIYSKRTDQAAKAEAEAANSGPKLPGPYSVNHP